MLVDLNHSEKYYLYFLQNNVVKDKKIMLVISKVNRMKKKT